MSSGPGVSQIGDQEAQASAAMQTAPFELLGSELGGGVVLGQL